ncbi:putative receptor-like protein kinase At4g00960 isoform X1 [Triticum dicoccoides]|uniref:putative receptor-like protein kinase At4g00960 isoform X1 n=1 Tax=Triticum dicoccoides TaxID=85692 RepID=UPI00188E2388|nr:putative receptor-like protein kinase At4g00960 isoform X1 [Triticum dicoccoides]
MDIEFHLLETITNKFADKVGSGGYGEVYKGLYNGKEIAVKRLHPLQGLDDKAFDSEFRNLSKVKHKNVVQLLGYCYQIVKKFVPYNGELVMAMEMERILCFEYMEGGSLDKHIGGTAEDESCGLDWQSCYQIIKGTCDGLNHLHGAHEKPIFHLDLKPSNILLDKNSRTAKIADLGLSRLVASTETHKTQMVNVKGTIGYMPPEYIDGGYISKKYDVFSLGVIILKIMTGNKGHSRCYEMPQEQFTKHVIENWEGRLQGTSGYSSHQNDILQVKKCIEIAVECVEKDRYKRPLIKDIVHQLEELEAKIKEMSLYSDMPIDLTGQTSSNYNILAVDPAIELRFLFEPRKDISTCMQLTNQTDGSVAFRVITNQAKYSVQPTKGIMAPCSKRYIYVTLRAQDAAPLNMQCNDMFVVQSTRVNDGCTSDGIADDEVMAGTAVGMVRLPIVYVGCDQVLG